MEIIFVVIGVIFIFYGSLIKFKKKISLIPALNEERLNKIKKVNKVANDFGNRIYLLAIAVFIFAAASRFFGQLGAIVGLVFIVVAAVSWNNLCSSIDEKIKKKKY